MSETVHDVVAKAVTENPHLAGSFDWPKLIQAVEAAFFTSKFWEENRRMLMSETVHDVVAKAVAENPHLAGSFDWSKLIQAVEAAIPVIMQIIVLFQNPAPAPTPTPTPVH